MELKEFIKTALVNIVEGTYEAKKVLDKNKDCICPSIGAAAGELAENLTFKENQAIYHQRVNFDVAVTTENTETNGGKVGIRVCGLEAGLGKNADVTNASTSRIRFHVPIALKSD